MNQKLCDTANEQLKKIRELEIRIGRLELENSKLKEEKELVRKHLNIILDSMKEEIAIRVAKDGLIINKKFQDIYGIKLGTRNVR